MTTNFGTDLYSVEDVDETRTVTGVDLVAQDAYWRLRTTPDQGIVVEDSPEGYGYDLEGAIGAADTPEDEAAIPDKIRSELKKDERILTVESTISRTVASNGAVEYDIAIRCETAEGPFELVGKAGDAGFNLALKLLPGAV
jgi:hypothetical protein